MTMRPALHAGQRTRHFACRGSHIRLLVIATLVATCACGEDTVTPTGPSTVTISSETWSSRLAAGGSKFYSFNVSADGTVTATLVSVTSPGSGLVLSPLLEIGFGIPAGTDCAVSTTRAVTPALVAQLLASSLPGIHCIRVADPGNLGTDVNFAVRFSHP
jgi:hypothetical protein